MQADIFVRRELEETHLALPHQSTSTDTACTEAAAAAKSPGCHGCQTGKFQEKGSTTYRVPRLSADTFQTIFYWAFKGAEDFII